MKQVSLRKTLAGGWEAFTFAKPNRYFFVKNFSDAAILVSFDASVSDAEAIKINAGMGEEVAITWSERTAFPFAQTDVIYVKGSGEVEVQALDIFEE